jgi:hypothetical protein
VSEVRAELQRLAKGLGEARATLVARRIQVALLLGAIVLAFASRAVVPIPPFRALGDDLLLALGAAAVLYSVGTALRWGLRLSGGPAPEPMARRLEDRLGAREDFSTALTVSGGAGPVGAFLAAQAAGTLRAVEPASLWPVRRYGRRLPLLLAFLFLFVLLAPGVSGLLGTRGAGRGAEADLGVSPEGGDRGEEPTDADAWMREHGRLFLSVPDPERNPAFVAPRLLTDLPLPRPYRARLELDWDGETHATAVEVDEAEGKRAAVSMPLRLDALASLRPHLTPGEHRLRARLVPRVGPWRAPLESAEVIVVLEPGGGGAGGATAPSPEAAPPPPPPPPPPPAPAPDGEQPAAPPPMPPGREEVVTPLVGDGGSVEKERAIVAVRDPEAGTAPPNAVPLDRALREFERVVESAVPGDRYGPSDREFLLRYFRALRERAGAR